MARSITSPFLSQAEFDARDILAAQLRAERAPVSDASQFSDIPEPRQPDSPDLVEKAAVSEKILDLSHLAIVFSDALKNG